jgi:thiol-disulfide isomerase/thioredoxin
MNRADRKSSVGQVQANRRKYLIWGTIALIAVGIIAAVAFSSRVPEVATLPAALDSTLKVGDKAPNFSAATTQGPFTLSTDAKGRPVFLEVMATWCPHCQRMTQVIDQLYAKYNGRVHFVAVTGDSHGMDGTSEASQADLFEFGQKFHVQYPIAFDPDLAVAKLYYQGGFPTIVLIDASGKVSLITSGEHPEQQLAHALDQVIAGKPASI